MKTERLPLRANLFVMKLAWWKILASLILMAVIIAGFTIQTPMLESGGLLQTIRNLFFHVPMWFNMVFFFFISFFYAIRYLKGFNPEYDVRSIEFAKIGVFFSVLGMITGMEWANYTWTTQTGQGGPWTGDPKQICAAIAMLIYFAYFILRGGIKDEEKRGRISAVYNIFACVLMVPLIFIIPRMVDSLHPGSEGGNPAMNPKHLDPLMRAVFYPAVIGWFLLGLWFYNIKIRMRRLQQQLLDRAD